MNATRVTAASETKTDRAQAALRELLAEATRKGFYGAAAIEVAVQDGVIQNIRRRIERIER